MKLDWFDFSSGSFRNFPLSQGTTNREITAWYRLTIWNHGKKRARSLLHYRAWKSFTYILMDRQCIMCQVYAGCSHHLLQSGNPGSLRLVYVLSQLRASLRLCRILPPCHSKWSLVILAERGTVGSVRGVLVATHPWMEGWHYNHHVGESRGKSIKYCSFFLLTWIHNSVSRQLQHDYPGDL